MLQKVLKIHVCSHTLKHFKTPTVMLKGCMLGEEIKRVWYRKECQSKSKLSDIHKGCTKLGENSDFSMVHFLTKTVLSFTGKSEPLGK